MTEKRKEPRSISRNIREGMRRLSIVAGILGGAVGAYLGYVEVPPTWDAYQDHKRFETVVASSAIQEVMKAARAYAGQEEELEYADRKIFPSPPPPPQQDPSAPTDFSHAKVLPDDWISGDRIVSVNANGIYDVLLDSAGAIISIRFLDGQPERRSALPAFPFVIFLYPILGFLVPWGAIRVITWIGEGFFRSRT